MQHLKNEFPEDANNKLFSDVCGIIDGSRYRIATTVNAEICLLNWTVGKRIKEDVLFNQRAEYGKEIVKNLAKQLTEKYGKGWNDRKLLHCIRSAYTFSEDEIGYALRTQFITWTHLRTLMFIDEGNVKVAQYFTQLPDKKLLSEKLQRAIAIAKEQVFDNKKEI